MHAHYTKGEPSSQPRGHLVDGLCRPACAHAMSNTSSHLLSTKRTEISRASTRENTREHVTGQQPEPPPV
eukprot:834120-Rhodomonas_salina.1